MTATLKWGIAGVGMIAHDFLTAMGTLPPAQNKVVAIAGKDLDKAHILANLHKVEIAYEGYEALALDSAIDIVFVCALNHQHYEISKLMLENGKHVLCEKPMCMDYKHTNSLVELAKAKELFLLEGMWSRFFPAYEALNEHLSSGGLGEVYHLNLQFGVQISDIERNLMKDMGGGVVYDLGVYMLQFAQLVFKEEPLQALCVGHLNKIGVDESMSCVLTYSSGKTATLSAHTRVNLNNTAEVTGTNGKIMLDYFWCPTVLQISAANNTEWKLPKGKFRFHFHNSAGLIYEIQECWDCINRGALESPKMTLADSLAISKLGDSLRAQLGVLEISD